MGMGYAGGYADVVETDFVQTTCPAEFSQLMTLAKSLDGIDDINTLAMTLQMGGDLSEATVLVFEILLNSFNDATGLQLFLEYQDRDHGDRYDEVDGAYWHVEGVYQYSPAGEKYKNHITRKNFVTFG